MNMNDVIGAVVDVGGSCAGSKLFVAELEEVASVVRAGPVRSSKSV
jgi:hypothetical protein